MERLYLIDAYALIYRSYYAFMGRPMRNRAGENTSAVFGFTKFLRDIIIKERPRYLGVAFDPKGGNFRNELYPEYKANREKTPEDILIAVPYIKRIIAAMRIPCLEVPRYEADDVIGTLAVKAAGEGFEVFMVTPDKDFGQLVGPHVKIYKQRKGADGIEVVGPEQLREQYGIDDPKLVIDILALWGDASDNIPGVPGIGEKGAVKLVNEFGTAENILAHVGELKGRQRDNIVASREQLLLSKILATIDTDAPIEFVPAELEMKEPDCGELRDIYRELDFNMFIREMDTVECSPFNGTMKAAERESDVQTGRFSGTDDLERNLFGSPSQSMKRGAKRDSAIAGDLFSTPAKEVGSVGRGVSDGIGRKEAGSAGIREEDAVGRRDAGSLGRDGDHDNINTVAHDYKIVNTPTEVASLVARLSSVGEFCFDVETSGFDFFNDRIVGISFAVREFEAFYVPISASDTINGTCPPSTSGTVNDTGQASSSGIANADDTAGGASTGSVLRMLKPLFEEPSIAKTGQNLKFDIMMLAVAGIKVRGFKYDTMLLHYLLDPESRHGMNHLSHLYLNYSPIEIETLIGRGSRQLTMDRVPVDIAGEYGAEDADVTLRLKNILWPQIVDRGLEKLYSRIEEPLIDTLAEIELTGVKIDTGQLAAYGKELGAQMAALENSIREVAGMPDLNINSPMQLGVLLFEKLKIDAKPKLTKTKQYSTDEEYLQSLADRHPVIGMILEYRGLKKLLSTYIEALPQLVNRKTGRVHTSFNQAVTSTGRLSSTNPNLQNIPIRDEQGRQIRKAFVPSDDDHLLLSADYSQVELRIMAHLSGDENLIEAFREGKDIHAATAARLFGIPLAEVTSEHRRKAKTANFGIIYGISAFGLCQRMGNISMEEAKGIIDGYFRSYPKVKEYMDNVIALARDNGYVETIFGRRRWLPDIRSSNSTVRSLAERNAINAPIQGSAADIIKIAMNEVRREFHSRGLRSEVILQVHDELVVDMLRSEEPQVVAVVKEAMEEAAQLSVRLAVDWGIGSNWLEAH